MNGIQRNLPLVAPGGRSMCKAALRLVPIKNTHCRLDGLGPVRTALRPTPGDTHERAPLQVRVPPPPTPCARVRRAPRGTSPGTRSPGAIAPIAGRRPTDTPRGGSQGFGTPWAWCVCGLWFFFKNAARGVCSLPRGRSLAVPAVSRRLGWGRGGGASPRAAGFFKP